MADPDREESSGDDTDREPDSDRSETTEEEQTEETAEASSEENEEETIEESTADGDEEPTADGDEEFAEPMSYDLDAGRPLGDLDTSGDEGDDEAEDGGDEEGDGGDEEGDGGDEEADGKEDATKNVKSEGTSPRKGKRRLRPSRDDGDDSEESDEGEGSGDGDEGEGSGDGDEGEGSGDGDEGEGSDDGIGGQEETVSNGAGATAGATATRPDEEPLFQGPESDEEMPLADHIEEMMRRLGVVFLVAGIATLIMYPSADASINYFWSSHIPDPMVNRPRVYGPLEYILTKLKVAGLAGVVFGLPVFVYETYLFMRPGLYRKERRYYIAAIPTSLVLAAIGSLFAHFIVLPAIFAYFTAYTEGTAVIAFGLKETFNLIVILIAYMAVVFQIPLLIQLAIMMNLVTRQWLEDKRLLFWGGFLGLSWLVTPDPTGMAPIVVTLTMIGLYEGTLALLRWTGN